MDSSCLNYQTIGSIKKIYSDKPFCLSDIWAILNVGVLTIKKLHEVFFFFFFLRTQNEFALVISWCLAQQITPKPQPNQAMCQENHEIPGQRKSGVLTLTDRRWNRWASDYIDDSTPSNFRRKQMKIHGDVNVQSLFHSFRHGFRSLSHNAHWVTSSGFQISIASSILSVAGLILAFRDERGRRGFNNLFLSWSSSSESESSPEKSWVVPGLQNLGNNCFLNVVLQVS